MLPIGYLLVGAAPHIACLLATYQNVACSTSNAKFLKQQIFLSYHSWHIEAPLVPPLAARLNYSASVAGLKFVAIVVVVVGCCYCYCWLPLTSQMSSR